MDFIGRIWEMAALDRFYNQPEAGLLVLYGRRRVGKTRLLEQWHTNRQIPNIFSWTAATRAPH
jgi:AAA+ ATPase superfamily predicted ATPase